jgi:hypothetical protein
VGDLGLSPGAPLVLPADPGYNYDDPEERKLALADLLLPYWLKVARLDALRSGLLTISVTASGGGGGEGNRPAWASSSDAPGPGGSGLAGWFSRIPSLTERFGLGGGAERHNYRAQAIADLKQQIENLYQDIRKLGIDVSRLNDGRLNGGPLPQLASIDALIERGESLDRVLDHEYIRLAKMLYQMKQHGPTKQLDHLEKDLEGVWSAKNSQNYDLRRMWKDATVDIVTHAASRADAIAALQPTVVKLGHDLDKLDEEVSHEVSVIGSIFGTRTVVPFPKSFVKAVEALFDRVELFGEVLEYLDRVKPGDESLGPLRAVEERLLNVLYRLARAAFGSRKLNLGLTEEKLYRIWLRDVFPRTARGALLKVDERPGSYRVANGRFHVITVVGGFNVDPGGKVIFDLQLNDDLWSFTRAFGVEFALHERIASRTAGGIPEVVIHSGTKRSVPLMGRGWRTVVHTHPGKGSLIWLPSDADIHTAKVEYRDARRQNPNAEPEPSYIDYGPGNFTAYSAKTRYGQRHGY